MITVHFEEAFSTLAESEQRMAEQLQEVERYLDKMVNDAEAALPPPEFPWVWAVGGITVFGILALWQFQAVLARLCTPLLPQSPKKRGY